MKIYMVTISDNITLRHHCISFIEYVLYTLKFRHLLENEIICESVLNSPEIRYVNAVPCCGPEHPQRGSRGTGPAVQTGCNCHGQMHSPDSLPHLYPCESITLLSGKFLLREI